MAAKNLSNLSFLSSILQRSLESVPLLASGLPCRADNRAKIQYIDVKISNSRWDMVLRLPIATISALLTIWLLAGCQLLPIDSTRPDSAALQHVTPMVNVNSFPTTPRCSGKFVTHTLDHTTMAPGGDTIQMFEANGSGVAINDLDGDGWQDIVLANHRDPNTILWNQGFSEDGAISFDRQPIGNGDARAALTVDVDGDGLLDIVFSRRVSAPNYWRNVGDRRFERVTLPGVSKPLYAINWADLDLDGDLDLVGGTYDAGLLAEFGQAFLNSTDAGVYVYMQRDGRFFEQPLALEAQALALALVDLNEDRRLDILVGNDFGVPDYGWLNLPTGDGSEAPIIWDELPLNVMSHSTMSYASGDVDNDGRFELFSTDMMPYSDDPATLAAWEPLMESMMDEDHHEGDPQIMANVLRRATTEQSVDLAPVFGVNASGWSWSGKFGDLDQDGRLDLYIVNGMIEATTFAHLPEHELKEENLAFRGTDSNSFKPAPEWNLNSTESGRGMTMADLDKDGDLDIVVNNLRGPAQLFENQLCLGNSLTVELHWPASENTRAIGSQISVHTAAGIYHRRVEGASGYLSGEAFQMHFGLGDSMEGTIEVAWPDGVVTVVEGIAQNSHVRIER